MKRRKRIIEVDSSDDEVIIISDDELKLKRNTISQQLSLTQSLRSRVSSIPWMQKYAPHLETDLCLHAKKRKELQEAILSNIDGLRGKRVLLVEGPTGCGKRTAVEVISRRHNISIVSWNVPSSASNYREMQDYQSEIDQFIEFAYRANRYGSLMENNQSSKCLYLVSESDLPDFNYSDASKKKFDAFLEFLLHSSRHLFVFLITSQSDTFSTALDMFGNQFCQHANVQIIKLPPVNPTNLKKIIKLITSKERLTIEPSLIDVLVEQSKGDVRSLINWLECASWNPNIKSGNSLLSSESICDPRFSCVHAAGKILRGSKTYVVEDVIADSDGTPQNLVDIVFENMYLDSIWKDIENVADLLDSFSDSDYMFQGNYRKKQYEVDSLSETLGSLSASIPLRHFLHLRLQSGNSATKFSPINGFKEIRIHRSQKNQIRILSQYHQILSDHFGFEMVVHSQRYLYEDLHLVGKIFQEPTSKEKILDRSILELIAALLSELRNSKSLQTAIKPVFTKHPRQIFSTPNSIFSEDPLDEIEYFSNSDNEIT